MTFTAADPIASGLPYDVVAVGGEPPARLDQFVGDSSFVIARNGRRSRVCGVGRPNEPGVHFQEKDVDHDGKDVRTWQISQGDTGFCAAPLGMF
jgi:hypothetical protein